MRFEVVSKEKAAQMDHLARMTTEERAAMEAALRELKDIEGQVVRVELLPEEKHATIKGKIRKVASAMGIERLLFRKAGDTHLSCWIASEQEWANRRRVGRKAHTATALPSASGSPRLSRRK